MTDAVERRPLIERLSDYWEEADAYRWLMTRQPLLKGAKPADMIEAGDLEPLHRLLDQLDSGVYI